MPEIPLSVLPLLALALIFDFLNGFHDSSNIVATMIASRALSGQTALALTALAEFIGPFLFGVAVATTLGNEVLNLKIITLSVTLAALAAAVIWNILTWYLGIPSSSSHALVGGLIGAAVIESGFEVVKLAGLGKVLLALVISPPLGFFVGYRVMKLVLFLARDAQPTINEFFKRAQIVTAVTLALSHGTNDAQKTMGVITMGLVAAGVLPTFQVPLWVIAISASAIALGTWFGGWRLIKTLGGKFYKIRPIHGFTAQSASAAVILGAALLGGPVSTTQVVSSAIMGVGSAQRVSQVRWGVAGQIVMAWFTTIPAAALMAAGIAIALRMAGF
ncbi:MAG: inorganic phosphate transporter [Chloroflexi bacterium]|nr:inorganic phosphate transporter [Chloroflexota bacterium]